MSKKKAKPLHEVSWLTMGKTKEYEELKADIQHVCKDVQGFIKEIAVNDIVQTFLKHGYVVIKKKD